MVENAKVKAMYRLFVGFRKLGEFGSILTAKRYAQESGLSGMFNLVSDDGYHDSWYVFESEAKQLKQQQGRTDTGGE
jgi:hypothetical protein